MGTPFLSEIKIVSFNFAPKGWAQCNGQLLPINQNQALFSLLGTTYGGDGITTFALPDFRGRAPVHIGNGIVQGQRAGEETHTLIISEMPQHNHLVSANTGSPNQPGLAGNMWCNNGSNLYSGSNPNSSMNPAAGSPMGSSQPHPNIQPFLVLNFIIALQGVFPSRN
jgi:microcystin-dependent protein